MRKSFIFPAAFIVLGITALWILGRVTGMLQLYSVPAASNAPAFKPGSHFFLTNLKKPGRNDFVAFRRNDPQSGKGTWFHRLVGLPGDIIEIQDGVVRINKKDADAGLNLMHDYAISAAAKDYDFFVEECDPELNGRRLGGDTAVFSMPDKLMAAKGIHDRRYFFAADQPDPFVQKRFGKAWNADQFGPLQVPPGHYFVLGDNRHNAMDSRYIGFIPAGDVVGVVIGK